LVYSNTITTCDESYSNGYYRIYGFKVSTDGQYTLNVNHAGGVQIAVYQSVFLPSQPNVNLYDFGGSTLPSGYISLPNIYYAVISSNTPGAFTLTITGPALVVPQPPPNVTEDPQGQTILRGETATMTFATDTPGASWEWFTGSCPAGKS